MSAKILHVNYRCTLSKKEFSETIGPSASDLAVFPGLRWKIWLFDEERGEGGGVHLFDDEASIEAYLSQVIEELKEHPAFSDVRAKSFDILDQPTATTRGPVFDGVPI